LKHIQHGKWYWECVTLTLFPNIVNNINISGTQSKCDAFPVPYTMLNMFQTLNISVLRAPMGISIRGWDYFDNIWKWIENIKVEFCGNGDL